MKRLLLCSLLLSTLSAGGALACDTTYCMAPNMPHLDQNGDGVYSMWHLNDTSKTTNLCVPTSLSMMMSSVVNTHSNLRWDKNMDVVHSPDKTWMDVQDFKNGSDKSKVHNMALVVETTKEGGTGGGPIWDFITRADDFFKNYLLFFPGGRYQINSSMNVTHHTMNSNVRNYGAPTGGYVNYGHYSKKLSSSFYGFKFYNITRGGGHAMAQRGYYKNILYIYDPWFKKKFWSVFVNVNSGWQPGTADFYTLPNGYSSVSVIEEKYNPGSYFPIMELNGSFGKRNW